MTTLQASTSFFVTGGTLSTSATSYVTRQADTDLFENLLAGEFCYVLNSRQMGKSSLMVRTAQRLKQEGRAVAVLDLQAIGQNLSPEQWYEGLLLSLGKQVRLEDELEEFWEDHSQYGPLQRFFEAIQAVTLPACPNGLVVFVDEIDIIRTLPFSADEFFMGIRQCFVGRATDSEWKRLTFCLLGTATPADLITDTRTSPFNIGRRIEVTDFTVEEAAPLAEGLISQQDARVSREGEELGRSLLKRILYWTSGHPYLTQRLCRVAVESDATTAGELDKLCTELFLTHRAKETEDNLMFVRNRLLKSEVDLAALLDLYRQVRSRKRVPYDETNPLCPALRLSGVCKVRDGRMEVRNRIYDHVFDNAWVIAHMPDAELRRQKQAYRRGLVRATVISAALLAVMGSLSLVAYRNARVAVSERNKAQAATAKEAAQHRIADERLFVAEMNLAAQAVEDGDLVRAGSLLDSQRENAVQRNLRDFGWRYLWGRSQGSFLLTLPVHKGAVSAVAFSPNGKQVASAGGTDRTLYLLDSATGATKTNLIGHRGDVHDIAFAPAGDRLASAGNDGARIWDVASAKQKGFIKCVANAVAWSSDRRWLAIGYQDGSLALHDAVKLNRRTVMQDVRCPVVSVAFSPDSSLIAVGYGNMIDTGTFVVRIWSAKKQRLVRRLTGHQGWSMGVAFSPDGKTLVTASTDSTVRLWDVTTWRPMAVLKPRGAMPNSVAYSPDGSVVGVGSGDGVIRLWNVADQSEMRVLSGHSDRVNRIAFSPREKRLASASSDGTVRLWDWTADPEMQQIGNPRLDGNWVHGAVYSRDGRYIAYHTNSDRSMVYDLRTWKPCGQLKGTIGVETSVAFLSDDRAVGVDGQNRELTILDLRTGKKTPYPCNKHDCVTVAASPDGNLLAVGSYETKTVLLWDARTKQIVGEMPDHQDGVAAVAFSPDGQWVASASHNRIIIWDVAGRRKVKEVDAPGSSYCLAFSPDGRTLAAVGSGKFVWLWDTHTWTLDKLSGHTDIIESIAFSPDGKTLASAGADGRIVLWNPELRKQTAVLYSRHGTVNSVAFSPDKNDLLAVETGYIGILSAPPFEVTDARKP